MGFQTEDADMPEPRDTKRIEIKKYVNRRFYDLTHSRHLKLDQIHALIKQGHEVHIVDAANGSDITAQVLVRIILELETPKLDLLPAPLLLWLIRMNDELAKDFLTKNLNQALKPFLEYQRRFQEQVQAARGSNPGFAGLAEWTKALAAPFAAAFSEPTRPKSPEPATPKSPAEKSHNEDLHELIRELKRTSAPSTPDT